MLTLEEIVAWNVYSFPLCTCLDAGLFASASGGNVSLVYGTPDQDLIDSSKQFTCFEPTCASSNGYFILNTAFPDDNLYITHQNVSSSNPNVTTSYYSEYSYQYQDT